MIITVDGRVVNSGRPIDIGVQGDNNTMTLVFDLLPDYASGQVVTLSYFVGDSDVAGTSILSKNTDGLYTFTVTGTITTHAPTQVKAYIQVTSGSLVWHTNTFYMRIAEIPDIASYTPFPNASLLDHALGVLSAAKLFAVTPEMYGAVGDGNTNDTAAIQSAINSSDNPIILFTNSYKCDGITSTHGATLIFEQDSIITAVPSTAYIFSFSGASEISVYGGTFAKFSSTKDSNNHYIMTGGEGTSGVFNFNACTGVNFRDSYFNGCSCGDMIYFLDSKQIDITGCRFKDSVRDCIMLKGKCENVMVKNCRFVDLHRSDSQIYSYGVASGEPTHSDTNYHAKLIKNFTIDNCYFENCEWEGADCHGGTNVRFSNNYFHNCYRFMSCFVEAYNIDEEDMPENAYIINNYCVNDDGYEPAFPTGEIHRAIVFSPVLQDKNIHWDNFNIENLTVINPSAITPGYGAISMGYFLRNLNIKNLKLVATKVYEDTQDTGKISDPIEFNGVMGLHVDGITIEGFGIKTGNAAIKIAGCVGEINNIHYRASNEYVQTDGAPYICRLIGVNYIKINNIVGKSNGSVPILNYDSKNSANIGDAKITNCVPTGTYYKNMYPRPITAIQSISLVVDEDAPNIVKTPIPVNDSEARSYIYDYLVEGVAVYRTVNGSDVMYVVQKCHPYYAVLDKDVGSDVTYVDGKATLTFKTKAAYVS